MTTALMTQMNDAREIIHTHYRNMPSLHKLALMVGTNECTLKKAFKQVFGTTVFKYLFNYRMQLALHYLLDTSLPISAISLQLGFEHQSHFCTSFRKKYNMAPSCYRTVNNI